MTDTIEYLTEQRANSEEIWKKDHDRAEQCGKLEQIIQIGLDLYNMCRSTDDLWSRRVQTDEKVGFNPDIARAIHDFYAWWIAPCRSVFKTVCVFEEEGYEVKGAAELRTAHKMVRSLLRQSVDDLIQGFAESRQSQ